MNGCRQQQGGRWYRMTERNGRLLRLQGITKVFSKGTLDEVTALNDVSLGVGPEDTISIIGSNGAGKTTLLNVISGVFPPERGNVFIQGIDVGSLPEHKRAQYIGRVHQDPNIGTAGKLTIEENLSFALLRGHSRGLKAAINEQRRELFRSVLAPLGLGLEDRLKTLVGTLSSGQRQAVALTMATLSRPALLLLDEHVANLDPKTAETVLNLTEMVIQREKLTTLMITHNMEIALRYGNRLLMMHRGKIIVDIGKEDKQKLTLNDLVRAFEQAAKERLAEEDMLLSLPELLCEPRTEK
jgi:putative ABC transport system ATP-binding protein